MLSTLRQKSLVPLLLLTLFGGVVVMPPAQQALEISAGGWTPFLVIVLVGAVMLVAQYYMMGGLAELSQRLRRATEGSNVGEPTQGIDEELHQIWGSAHHFQRQLERSKSSRDRQERDLERLSIAVEQMMRGQDAGDKLELRSEDEAIGALVEKLAQLNAQQQLWRGHVDRLKKGDLELEMSATNSLQVKKLSEIEVALPEGAGALERALMQLQNALRRLTVQTHVIAADRLESALLDEPIAGELGDAFSSMVKNLRQLGERARQIAAGDLSLSETGGEGNLHTSFDAMVEGLREVVEQITQTAVRISSSAEEILAVLREQELSASHQASGVEETQRTMETLLSSAKKIAESAQTVFKSAERTQANNRIISDRASELKSHTERIGEILESIKEIADRSDLLALNASLEGLRAGEAGKGFTLVANEMRRLAENIKGSVGDIKELLSDIRESALSSVMAIEEGTRLSERTTDSALKITLITQQQQSGTEQVTQSMEELSHLINQGLAGTRQVTTAASELADLSDDMRRLVDAFNLEGRGRLTHTSGMHALPRPSGASEWKRERSHSISNPRQASLPQRLAGSPSGGRAPALGTPRVASTPARSETVLSGSQGAQPASSKGSASASAELPVAATSAARGMTGSAEGSLTKPQGSEGRLKAKKGSGKEELNATMRFVGYGDAPELLHALSQDSPTLDVSKLSSELAASDYEDMDSLFHELDAASSSAASSESKSKQDDE